MPAATMRTIRWPGDSTWFTDQQNAPPSIQAWLATHAPQLAAGKINPSPALRALCGAWGDGPAADYNPGRWIHRCAANWQLSPEPGLLRLQIEQDLLAPDVPLEGYVMQRIVGASEPPPEWSPLPWNQPVGNHYFMDTHAGQPGLVLVRGDRRLACACGFAIPDRGRRAPWSLTSYGAGLAPELGAGVPVFGLEAQIAFFHWFMRRQFTKWDTGLPPNFRPEKTRLLYPTEAEKAAALAEGRKPRGEMVLCGDAATYWAAGYTPYEPGFDTIVKMATQRGFA